MGNKKLYMVIVGIMIMLMSFNAAYAQGALTGVSLAPANVEVGATGIHTLSFTLANNLPLDAKIWIDYDIGFDFSPLALVSSNDLDGSLSLSSNAGRITITRSGGSIVSGGTPVSIQLINIANHTTASPYTVTVTTLTNADITIDTGVSAAFSLTPASMDYFSISTVSTQTAGDNFSITITAMDEYDNQAISFASTATLFDLTGTLSLSQTTNFTAGQWTGNVNVQKAHASNHITVSESGKSGDSNDFIVSPAALDYFAFGTINSPQSAGADFSITIAAYDRFDNVQTNFSGSASLADDTGTIVVPSTSGSNTEAFVNGVWSGNVQITQSSSDNRIVVTGSGQSGTSGYFNVVAGTVDHFVFSSIGSQNAGAPFLVSISAFDAYNNTVISFTNAVSLTDLTGTLTVQSTGTSNTDNFNAGIWTGNVQIITVQQNNVITADQGSVPTGQSAPFNVVANYNAVDHFEISAIPASLVAGDAIAITIRALDVNDNLVNVDNEVLNIIDVTKSIAPSQVTLSGGTWAGNVVIVQSTAANQLTVAGLGESSQSNSFIVTPGSLHHFTFQNIPSPQLAGNAFTLNVQAEDNYNNIVDSYTGGVEISVSAGNISPAVSNAFINGLLTQTVTIPQANNDITISVNDQQLHTGNSNLFNVVPGALHHFTIATISDQATGEPFSITVTAKDNQNNTVTSFNGSGNTVNISHNGGTGITPTSSDGFLNGVWIGNITISQTQSDDYITVIRNGGSETGNSNTFDVTPLQVDHFDISAIAPTQVAGHPFGVTFTAQDAANNTVTSFNGTAVLFDETATNTPRQINFVNGSFTAQVTVTEALDNNSLTINAQGKSGTSNDFDVIPDDVAAFTIGLIPSPQVVGQSFTAVITARDNFGNVAVGFSGYVNLSEITGAVAISPSTSGNFTDGVRTEQLVIIQNLNNLRLRILDGSGNEGISNYFNVQAGSLHEFSVNISGNQIAGDPFSINVSALDNYGNIAPSFSGTVDISDNSGTVQPIVSGNFVNGQWSGNVTVFQAVSGDRIRVVRSGGTESGQSAQFNLAEPPGIRIVYTEVSQASVTAGQTRNWTLKMALSNLSSHSATLEQIDIDFILTGQSQLDYTVSVPSAFMNSQTAVLAGSSVDTVLVTVQQTGSGTGDIHIAGTVTCRDSNTGKSVPASASMGIVVQTAAVLDIAKIEVSQDSVTSGQDVPWYVDVILQNTGQADMLISSAAVDNVLSFSIGSQWTVLRPDYMNSGGWLLAGGAVDTLHFSISHSGENNTGNCIISALLSGQELNSLQSIADNTADHGTGSVWLELEPDLRIDGVVSLAPNGSFVNQGQSFWVRVYVQNLLGTSPVDGIHDVQVSLSSGGFSAFPQGPSGLISHLSGGERDSVDILIQAAPSANPIETFTASAGGKEDNTGRLISDRPVNPSLNSTQINIQQPGNLIISEVAISYTSVIAGQVDPWSIDVIMVNTGGAGLDMAVPGVDDIRFFASGVRQQDYIVELPSELAKGGMFLAAGAQDTLKYLVTSTGRLGGNIDVQCFIDAVDKNSLQPVSASQSSTIEVEAETEFRIIQTSIRAPNRNDAGNASVNTAQAFEVVVKVENGLGETIRDIQIDLSGNGNSLISNSRKTIARLRPQAQDSVVFQVTATLEAVSGGETFNAVISGGTLASSNTAAPIGPALDSGAVVYIQTPASLVLGLNLDNANGQFSTDQVFTLNATLSNLGQESVGETGQVKVVLPDGYTLEAGENQIKSILIGQQVSWLIHTSVVAHESPRTIYVIQEVIPTAINSELQAMMAQPTVSVDVQTVATSLSGILSIKSPDGAKDGILSTGQSFIVNAVIAFENIDRIEASLTLPPGYTTADNLIKSVNTENVFWHIQGPATAALARNIQLIVSGYDVFQPTRNIVGQGDILEVTTVSRAVLKMTMETSDNSVSLGQIFTVTATLSNTGTANVVGQAAAELTSLPGGYQTSDPFTQIFVNGKVQWQVKAPIQPTQDAISIVAQLSTVPLDENTSETAYVAQLQDKVAMTTVGAWLSVNVLPRTAEMDGLVAPGEKDIWLAAYEFVNRGEAGANGVVFNALRFYLETPMGDDIIPSTLLSGCRIVGMKKQGGMWVPNETDVYGELGQGQISDVNPFRIPFTRQAIVAAKDTIVFAILGDIHQRDTDEKFLLNLRDRSSIEVRDEYSPSLEILVFDVTGAEFVDFISFPYQIMGGDQIVNTNNVSLIPCPNPFGMTEKNETYLVYNLPESTDVSFMIFTLTGALVWQKKYDKGSPQGAAGLHGMGSDEVTWDGRTANGERVLNGVYICYLKTGSGTIVSTKIAVVF
ncbi:hypothetical protein KAR48_04955 [bacterium]|nr:hypothetical protein [bacterium]